MEAIGAIASIIGVAGAGAKLSIMLFDFASTVGSAGQEVKRIGIEISLFCSVLKQLQSTLTKAKAYRYSLSALETTQEILDRCQEVFQEIENVVDALRKRGEGSTEPSVDLIARVKWTLKRSKVQVLRTTLESCKVTLHLMLTTLDFAQKIATRRSSTIETQAEDEHQGVMTRSLIIAHQCTVDTLQELEEEEVQHLAASPETELLTPPWIPGTQSVERVMMVSSKQKPSGSFDTQYFQPYSPGERVERKRTSIWINDLMFDKSPLPYGFRRQTWGVTECASFLEHEPHYFLRKWTNQGEHLNELRRQQLAEPQRHETQSYLPGIKTDNAKTLAILESSDDSFRLARQTSNASSTLGSDISPDPVSPDSTYTVNSIIPIFEENKFETASLSGALHHSPKVSPKGDSSVYSTTAVEKPAGARNVNATVEIFKSFRVSIEDPTYIVLPAALKKYRNFQGSWEDYALYIVYGDKEICLGLDEKPLLLFRQLDEEGEKPMFMLRKMKQPWPKE